MADSRQQECLKTDEVMSKGHKNWTEGAPGGYIGDNLSIRIINNGHNTWANKTVV